MANKNDDVLQLIGDIESRISNGSTVDKILEWKILNMTAVYEEEWITQTPLSPIASCQTYNITGKYLAGCSQLFYPCCIFTPVNSGSKGK